MNERLGGRVMDDMGDWRDRMIDCSIGVVAITSA
jgi:hypothetical protein